MVQTIRIEAAARERAGKGAARATRREGLVPGVVYGAKREATLIQLDPRVIMKEMHKGGWQSHIYEVVVANGPTETVLMREIQFHPVSDKPIHVDFQRLAAGQRIRVGVAVHFLNEATSPGIKKGGVLNVVRHTVEVMADPEAIPEFLTADLGPLDIAANIRWSDLSGTEALVPVITGRDFVIATLAPPTKGAEPVADPAAPAAAAAPAKGTKAPAKPKK